MLNSLVALGHGYAPDQYMEHDMGPGNYGPSVIEITRAAFDFNRELTVVEHKPRQVTIVSDGRGTAPVFSGMRIQLRKAQ